MVSLLNNHGIRYYLSQNDALSTNYPYYLYDAYPYPTLNRFDYQQNLLYQQNAIPPEQKKSKKSKKKASGEKTSKEHVPFFDYKKEDLIQWLKSLSLEERFEIFSIKNSWLAIAFVKMYKRWSESHDTVFALLVEESKKPSHDKSSLEFGELDNHFYCRKQIPMTNPEKQVLIEKAEKEIITNLKIYDDTDFYDTIIFKEELLQDMDKVIQLFDTISEGSTFMTPCKITTDYNTKAIMLDSPLWFNSNSFQTFAAWIVSNFEKTIWARYFQNRRNHPRSSSPYGILDFKFTLNYKKSLREFWKGLDKNKKKKLVSAANETFKNLTCENNKNNSAGDGKEINKLLKSHYDSSLFTQAKESITAENLNQYFVHLLEEENEVVVIETIVMTSMDQFGTIPNLICRKLNHKLRNMLSEKIASDLILNEEREKKNNNNNNNKKKPSKKKKGKKNSHHTPASEEKPEQETQSNGTVDLQSLDAINLIVHNTEEGSKTGSTDPKTFVTQIKDLESQQTYDVIGTRKPNENFISHTIADASTCNDSGTEEKCDSDNVQLTDRIDSKNHKCGSLTPLKEGKDKESKSSSKSNQESATNKNSSSLQIDDSWLEELDNKISKSQKKKQKRKAKKKAEQEQMKAEELEKEIQNSNSKNSIESSAESTVEETPKPKEKENNKVENSSQNKQKETNNAKKNNENHKNIKPESQKPSEVPVAPKDESLAKTPTSATISAVTETFDDFGFIEVKAKKKTPKELEKDKRSKGRKDGKEGGRRKRKDNEPAPTTSTTAAAEKKNPPVKESAAKPKSPQNNTETKKSLATEKPSHASEKATASTTICTETETHQKSNVGIPKVIMATNRSNLKAAAPKPLKKTVSTIAVSSLENPTEPAEPIPALNKAMSQNNATTNSNNNHHAHDHHHSSHSVPSGRKNQNHANHDSHHKSHKPHHPLSLTSPSLDLETIRIAKTKEYAHEFFDKKFESDIYKHVVKLTDAANKMMTYRILAYNRLDYCVKHMFPKFNIKTKIYGSCATGLALTASDVDISVEGIEAFDRNQLSEYFVKISNSLKGFKWVTENKPILTATVPILKLEVDVRTAFADIYEDQVDKETFEIPLDPAEKLDIEDKGDITDYKIRIDLSLESSGGLGYGVGYNVHVGYKTTAFVMQMLDKYKSLYIVTMVLKEFLSTRQLLNTYQGGISSYCLVIMIVAIFQKFEDKGYMASLKQFFNFYGEIFKPETTGITLIEADPFFPLNHLYETAPFWVIEHSTFKGKNIGQGCFSIKIIQHEFARVSRLIDHFKQRIEEIAIKNQTAITCVEDIEKIENEPELKALINCNILELMMAPEITFPQPEVL